jgi:hypothetical protein
LFTAGQAGAVSPNVVISQVYGGGGNTGATYTHDFIELFNRGNAGVSLNGMSLQYASATGTGNFGATTTQITPLPNVTLAPGQYYLVQEATNAAVGAALPTPDATDASPIALSASAGKVALVNSAASLGCNGGSTACSASQLALIIDLVGYGNANFYEGAGAAPTLSATTAALRAAGGCTDTDNNGADFTAPAPSPRNSSSTYNICPDSAPAVSSTTPANGALCVVETAGISVTFSEPVNVAGSWFTIACTSTGAHTAAVSGGPTVFTLDPDTDFATAEACTVTIVAAQVTDQDIVDPPDNQAANYAWTFTTPGGGVTPIHDIQGPGASSPLSGIVITRGVVTGVKGNGYFIQAPDASADADPLTSEGIFVFTSAAPPAAAAVGNLLDVRGTISEYSPSADPLQPPLTELTFTTQCVVSTGNPLPAAIPLTASFPASAGPFDQLERLEGMRVSVASLTVVAPTNGNINEPSATATSWGEFHGVVTGVGRPFREPGIQWDDPGPNGTIPRWDTNPEIIRVDSDGLTGSAAIDVGTGAVVTGLLGPLDYSYRRYTVMQDPGTVPGVSGGPSATAVQAPTVDEVTVASFNAQRFFDTVADPVTSDPVLTAGAYDGRLDKLSLAVRNQLRFPDIIAFMEVEHLTTLQDVAARISSDALAALEPDPEYDAYLMEGNDVGGIDVGFLVKTAPISGSTPRVEAVAIMQEGGSTTWTDPSDNTSRLLNDRPPLVLEAIVHFADGRTYPITVIAVHQRSFNGIDDPSPDGFVTSAERVQQKRREQSKFLAGLIEARQVADSEERIVVVGDFNAFEFNDGYVDVMGLISGSPLPDDRTVVTGDDVDLIGSDLTVLTDTVPAADRYSYTFDGCAQSLDHAVANAPLLGTAVARIEHARIGADFPEIARVNTTTPIRLSDHDPLVLYLALDADGDGIADSVDPCDDALAPAFATTGHTATSLSGTVEDCSGVAAVVLAPGSVNLQLVLGGNPGDPVRTWTVSLADPYRDGAGALLATDGSAGPEEETIAVALQELQPVPALDGAGLALLVLLLAVAGALVAGRRSLP